MLGPEGKYVIPNLFVANRTARWDCCASKRWEGTFWEWGGDDIATCDIHDVMPPCRSDIIVPAMLWFFWQTGEIGSNWAKIGVFCPQTRVSPCNIPDMMVSVPLDVMVSGRLHRDIPVGGRASPTDKLAGDRQELTKMVKPLSGPEKLATK